MSETVYIGVQAFEELMGEEYEEFVESLECDSYFIDGSDDQGTVPEGFDMVFSDTGGRGHLPSAVKERSALHEKAVFSGYRANKALAISASMAGEHYEEVAVDSDHSLDLVDGECRSLKEVKWLGRDESAFRRLYATGAEIVSSSDLEL